MQSRVYSDGKTATEFYYAVYEESTDGTSESCVIEKTQGTSFSGLTTTLSLQLVTGKTYKMVFWAQSPNASSLFTVAEDLSSVEVKYDAIANLNVEDVDAFWCMKEVPVTGASTVTAELKRPFAQINVGTSDINVPSVAGKKIYTKMTVANVFSKYNLLTGLIDANDEGAAVTFAGTLRPNDGKKVGDDGYEAFPVGNVGAYEYLAMAYVLMSPDKQTADIDLDFYDGETAANSDNAFHHLDVDGAPLQRNYRTNIFGALLTSTIDFTINIIPEYDGSYNDARDLTALTPNADGVYEINSAHDMASVPLTIESVEHNEGKVLKFKLNVDVDMDGWAWSSPSFWFVNIDGQGHTVKNLVCTQNQYGQCGFAGYLGAGHIENITFENITSIGSQAGIVAGNNENGVMKNVTIKGNNVVKYTSENPGSSYVETYNGIGAIAGVTHANSTGTVTIAEGAVVKLYHGAMATVCSVPGIYTYKTAETIGFPTVTDNGTVICVWDGTSTATPVADSTGAYIVNSAAELAGLQSVLDDVNKPTVKLAADIDLGGKEWTPLVYHKADYAMTLDGDGHSISNYTLTGSQDGVGLFGGWTVANFKNLTLENVTITTGAHKFVGALAGDLYGSLENITVKDITIVGDGSSSVIRVGGIVGLHNSGGATNIVADNVQISGVYHSAGGMFGTIGEQNHRVFDQLKISNSNISIVSTGATGKTQVGAIVGVINVDTNLYGTSNIVITNYEVINTVPEKYFGGTSQWPDEELTN